MSFQDKGMSMFASMESRNETLVGCMKAQDHEVLQKLIIYKIVVSA